MQAHCLLLRVLLSPLLAHCWPQRPQRRADGSAGRGAARTRTGDQYAADWVGIDGAFNNDKLVQAGTTSENIGGEAKYYAWTEILPASAVRTSLAIHPGDLMTAEVREVATDKWKMTVVDGTTGKTFARAVSYTTPEQDVEAVHERPMISGSLSALAKTDNVEFLGVWASTFAPGRPPGWEYISGHFPGATRDRVFMVNHGGGAIIRRAVGYY